MHARVRGHRHLVLALRLPHVWVWDGAASRSPTAGGRAGFQHHPCRCAHLDLAVHLLHAQPVLYHVQLLSRVLRAVWRCRQVSPPARLPRHPPPHPARPPAASPASLPGPPTRPAPPALQAHPHLLLRRISALRHGAPSPLRQAVAQRPDVEGGGCLGGARHPRDHAARCEVHLIVHAQRAALVGGRYPRGQAEPAAGCRVDGTRSSGGHCAPRGGEGPPGGGAAGGGAASCTAGCPRRSPDCEAPLEASSFIRCPQQHGLAALKHWPHQALQQQQAGSDAHDRRPCARPIAIAVAPGLDAPLPQSVTTQAPSVD